MDNLQYVTNYITSILGGTIVPLINSETNAIIPAIKLALVDYWKAFPYIGQSYIQNNMTKGTSTRYIPISSILDELFINNPSARSSAYYIGIYRLERFSIADSWANPAYVTSFFTMMSNYSAQAYNSVDVDKYMISKSKVAGFQGVYEWYIDNVNKQVVLTLPYDISTGTLFHCIGFNEDGIDYIDPTYLDVLGKMSAIKYLEMIITSRSAFGVNSDYTVNTSFLESKLNELKEEVKTAIEVALIPVLLAS